MWLAGLSLVLLLGACGSSDEPVRQTPQPTLVPTALADPAEAISNGIDEVTPQEALAQAREALLFATSYRVSGAPTAGAPLDLVFVAGEAIEGLEASADAGDGSEPARAGRGSVGTVSQDGSTFKLRAVDGDVYVQGNLEWLADTVVDDAARTLGDKWLLLPESVSADLVAFTDPSAFAEAVLSPTGSLQSVGASVIDGTPAVGIRFLDSEATAWVAGVGEPYPVLVERLGATATDGVLRLSGFDEAVTLTAPDASDVVVAPSPPSE